jgi:hypothetical protein
LYFTYLVEGEFHCQTLLDYKEVDINVWEEGRIISRQLVRWKERQYRFDRCYSYSWM